MSGSSARPRLSVVIPTYNRRELVREAVRSALALGEDVEVVLVDDGSTDGTSEQAPAWGDRLHLITQEQAGRSAARNRGVAAARGEYVCFLDSDDLLEPWHAKQWRQAAARTAGTPVFSADVSHWDPDTGRLWTMPLPGYLPSEVTRAALVGTVLPLEGLFIPQQVLTAVGGFDTSLSGSEDWVFVAQLVRAAGDVVRLPSPSVRVRHHDGRSMSDIEWDLLWRARATDALLQAVAMDEAERTLVRAGTARYCAARLYEVGRVREARARLAEVRQELGPLQGWRWTWRLTLQSLLGARVRSSAAQWRQVRRRAGRRTAGGQA